MAQIKLKLDDMCLQIERYLKEGYRVVDGQEEQQLKLFDAYRVALKISPDPNNTLEIKSDGLYSKGDPATCGLSLVCPDEHEGLLVGYLSEWNLNREGHNERRISCKGIVHRTFTADWDEDTQTFINLRGVDDNDILRVDESVDGSKDIYDVLLSEPADWSTHYYLKYYYMDIGAKYNLILRSSTPPTWEANKYYEKREPSQQNGNEQQSSSQSNVNSSFDPESVTTNPPDGDHVPSNGEGVRKVIKRFTGEIESRYVVGGMDAILYNVYLVAGSPLYDRSGDESTGYTFTPRTNRAGNENNRYRIQGHMCVDANGHESLDGTGQWWVHQIDKTAPDVNVGWWAKIDRELVPGLEPVPDPKQTPPNGYRFLDVVLPGDFIRTKVAENDGDPLYDYYIITHLTSDGEIDTFSKIIEHVPESVALNDFVPSEEEGEEDPDPPAPPPVMVKQPVITMQYDTRIFDVVWIDAVDPETNKSLSGYYYTIKLSNEPNNALHINEYGILYCTPKISDDPGWSLYYPGNSIKPGEGGSYKPVETLRCNSMVSRIKSGDPLKTNEGVNTNTILLKIKEILNRREE